MFATAEIHTSARLHFGLLAVKPAEGRRFGGVGVMIERPGFRLKFSPSHTFQVHGGSELIQARIRRFYESWLSQASLPANSGSSSVSIKVFCEVPSHYGLGSGTQLGLAVGRGLHTLFCGTSICAQELAKQMGRGERSAIGVHGFDEGGFLIEAGQSFPGEISPLVARVEVPEDWRWLLVMPCDSPGLSGTAEQHVFRQMESMTTARTAELCRLLLMEWLPAMQGRDFSSATRAMWHYGQNVGEFFSSAQGGTFAHPRMAAMATALRQRGEWGIAQTSWGPTVAILCRDEHHANSLSSYLQIHENVELREIIITPSQNRGAMVMTTPEEVSP